jgi:hypothetical protein
MCLQYSEYLINYLFVIWQDTQNNNSHTFICPSRLLMYLKRYLRSETQYKCKEQEVISKTVGISLRSTEIISIRGAVLFAVSASNVSPEMLFLFPSQCFILFASCSRSQIFSSYFSILYQYQFVSVSYSLNCFFHFPLDFTCYPVFFLTI